MATTIRIGALEGFRDFVFELGTDPAPVLEKAGIDERLWQTPNVQIPSTVFRTALNLAAEFTGTPQFGLLLSQRQSFEKLGSVGYLVRNAPTLVSAISTLDAYLGTHDSGVALSLQTTGRSAFWSIRIADIDDQTDVQRSELGLGLGARFLRSSVDPHWSPQAVHFSHSRPASLDVYHRVFRCPVFFEQEVNCMEFKESDLARPLLGADPALYDILLEYTHQLFSRRQDHLVDDVRFAIRDALESGKPSLDTVAAQCGKNRAQMQRSLRACGTSYQKLLDEERFMLAKRYLRDTRLSVTVISSALGYRQLAVFTRAFKRQAGVSPSVWRTELEVAS